MIRILSMNEAQQLNFHESRSTMIRDLPAMAFTTLSILFSKRTPLL